MATGGEEKLESMLECPICFIKLTNPRAFQCLHIFCQPCIDDLDPTPDGNIPSYKCPICRQLTPITNVRPMPFLRDLLEVVEIVKHQQPRCEQCNKENASHRCADCKKNMCAGCRELHDVWLKGHNWAILGDDNKDVVDNHVHCKKHPSKIVEFNCRDCNELMCILCNGSEHKHHHADTIEDAIKNLLPIIKTKQKNVLSNIKNNKETLSSSKAKLAEINKKYDDIEQAIRDKKQHTIHKLEEDTKLALKVVIDIKKKHIKEVETVVRDLELEITNQKNIVAMTDTALTTAQGTSLLQTLQSDVTASLTAHENKPAIIPVFITSACAMFSPTPTAKTSLIGTVTNTSGSVTSGVTPITPLCDLESKNVVLKVQRDLNYQVFRFHAIETNMWLVEWDTNKIHVLSKDGQEIKTIVIEDIGKCRSVARAIDNVAVASTTGVYFVDLKGDNLLHLIPGNMCDVSSHEQQLFTLDDGMRKVHHHAYSTATKSYVLQNSFLVENYNIFSYNSIQATKDKAYVAMWNEHCIREYSHTGQLIRAHGSYGSGMGKMQFPWLCDADHQGTVLIADQSNHRLQTLSRDGTWTSIKVNGLQCPRSACLIGDILYVLQFDNARFKAFTVL